MILNSSFIMSSSIIFPQNSLITLIFPWRPAWAHVSIHSRWVRTTCLICCYNAVIGNDGSFWAKERACVILDKIVLEASAKDISASSEPAYKIGVGSRSFQVATRIAIWALWSEKVGRSNHVKCSRMRFEHKITTAIRNNSSVCLPKVIKSDVFDERFTIEHWLFAYHIKSCAKFGR